MKTRGTDRRGLRVALAAYALILAVVLLAPTSEAQSETASWSGDLLIWLGLPESMVNQARVEFLCNALIVMPVSALGSLIWPRTTWRDWTAYAFVLAGFVEVVQGLLLPARTAGFVDVAANTLGGLGGAAVVALGRRARRSAS